MTSVPTLVKTVAAGSLMVLLAHSGLAQHILKGRVMSRDAPLPNAIVRILTTGLGSATDSAGRFAISNSLSGNYGLEITFLGYDTIRQPVSFDHSRDLDLGDINIVENSKAMKEVVITGKFDQGSERSAIDQTRKSSKIETILSQEGIQQLPDKNVAEAVQRVAGAKMARNKGEGANVSLRGTPGDWTSTLINGDRLPTADEDNPNRTFEFEVFPSNLVDNIFVTRTVTPDLEADNIGGVINFQTTAPLDKKTFNIDLGGGQNLIAGKPLLDLKLLMGNVSRNKKFAWSLSSSYYYRPYGADALQFIYGSNFNHGINKVQLRDYFGERTTFGVNGAAEYKVNSRLILGAHLMHGRTDDNKYKYEEDYNYSDGSGQRIHQLGSHGVLQRRLYGGDVTAVYSVSPRFTIDFKAASYTNSFQYGHFPNGKNDSINGYTTYDFISNLLQYKDLVYTDSAGNPVSSNTPNANRLKLIGKDNPYPGGDNYNNVRPMPDSSNLVASSFHLYEVFSEVDRTKESDPLVLQTNFNYKINDKIKLKFGLKGRYKEGSRYLTLYSWFQQVAAPPIPSDPIPLTHFQLSAPPRNGSFLSEIGTAYQNKLLPFLSTSQMASLITQLGDTLRTMPMVPYNTEYYLWVGSNYKYFETTESGYMMAEVSLGEKWKLAGGVRIENTHLHESADTLSDSLTSKFIGGNFYVYSEPRSVTVDRSYIAILPSLNAEYLISSNSILRLAASRTFHRPNFEETKPGAAIIKYQDLEYTYGNPYLKPTYSVNLDAAYQYYWGTKGILVIGGYYKNVTDHIFTTVSADVDPYSGILIKHYNNAASAYIAGVEAAIDKKFDFLRGFWGGFGVNANITYSYSEMQVPGRPKTQAMNEQTPLLYNVGIYYEKGRIKTRLGLNYTGPYLVALNLAAEPVVGILHKDAEYDLFRGETYSLDYQLTCRINKRFSAFGEANNLLDAPYKTYIGQVWRVKRVEYYHQRVEIGLKFEL